MTKVAGIKLHKTPTGKVKSVTIDLKKHGELFNPILQQLGAVEQEYEDDFEREWATGIPLEQARAETLAIVRSLPWKEKKNNC